MSSSIDQKVAGAHDKFGNAWQALRNDSSVQFNLPPPPTPPKPPAWLQAVFDWLGEVFEPVGRFIKWIGSFFPDAPYARILLWTVIAIGAAALAWALYNRLKHGEWNFRLPRRAQADDLPAEEEWVPAEAGARSWLEEADALAGQGRFTEAIHHLLVRSVEDITRRRPALVRPALTSRELAASQAIPDRARTLFSGIARMVELSWFGGKTAGAEEWSEARTAYADFALPTAWRA